MAPTEYVHLDIGVGGVFDYSKAQIADLPRLVGTQGCRTSVCVYIPISETKCFAAHMNATVQRTRNSNDADWIPNDTQAQKLIDSTKERLAKHLPEFANGEYATHPLRYSAAVICPRRTVYLNGNPHLATGFYIVHAINQFFCLLSNGVTAVAHGFVADVGPSLVDFLQWQRPGGVQPTEDQLNRYLQLVSKVGNHYANERNEWIQMFREGFDEKKAVEYGYKGKKTAMRGLWSFRWNVDGQWDIEEIVTDERLM